MSKKIAIIYKSETGFTEKYARMIAEETGADFYDFKDCPKNRLAALPAEYDQVVFGSRFHAGAVDGLKKAINLFYGKGNGEFIVFATGAMPSGTEEMKETLEQLWKNNFTAEQLEKIPHFYFQAGLCYEKMSAVDRFMMKCFCKMLKNKKDKTPADIETEKAVEKSFDISSREFIKPLTDYLLKNR